MFLHFYVNFIEGLGMKKTALNMALSSVLIVSFGMSLSACSDKESKVVAPDRVDEAAELARSKAPEAEVMDFPEVEQVPTDAEADASMTTEEGMDADTAETDTTGNTAVADSVDAGSADAESANADSADAATAETTATE